MTELIHLAQSFINAEDVIITKKKKKGERLENGYIHHLGQGPHPKKTKVGEKRDRDGKEAGLSSGRYSNYTPLNTPLDLVLMQIKDDPSLKWPERMQGDPSKWNKSKYYSFHHDHGHDKDKCYDLKQQIETLIKRGKLKKFLGQDHKNESQLMKGKAEEPTRLPLGQIRIIEIGRAHV